MKGAKETASADQVKEVTEFTKESFAKIETARSEGDFQKVAKLAVECLEKQEPVLADTNLLQLRMLSTASEVFAFRQNFTEAAQYSGRMVEGYRKLYHPKNAQLGMAIMRAGVTNWHAGLIEEGHGLICKAFAILMVTHGPNHPIVKDLEKMRKQTEMELKLFRKNEDVYHVLREAALKDDKPAADEKTV